MADHIESLVDELHTHGAECFQHCSKGKIESLCDAFTAMITPENVQILKRRNPRKLELVKKLLLPYHESIKKIGDPRVSIHEKEKLFKNLKWVQV